MNKMEIIETLCGMLHAACEIISKQAAIMEQHGIATDGGGVEAERAALLESVEKEGW